MIRVTLKPSGRQMAMEPQALVSWLITQRGVIKIECSHGAAEITIGPGPEFEVEEKLAWARQELGVGCAGCGG